MPPCIKGQALGVESSPDDLFRDSSSEKLGLEEIVQGSDGEGGVDGGEIETEDRKKIPNPQLPHPDIVAEHNIDHTPYRSWCRWCLEGRGVGEQHRPSQSQHDIPVIGMDYFYLTGKGLQSIEDMGYSRDKSGLDTLEELVENGAAAKCLIVNDQNSECISFS